MSEIGGAEEQKGEEWKEKERKGGGQFDWLGNGTIKVATVGTLKRGRPAHVCLCIKAKKSGYI